MSTTAVDLPADPVAARRPVSLTRVFAVELADDLRGVVREPTALFFSIVMPVGFFVLFASMFGKQNSGMLATFGTFGVLAVTLMNPGMGVAKDRERGWLRAKQVSAVPVGVTLAAKVAAAFPYAVGVLVAMAVAAAATGSLAVTPGQLARLALVLVLGAFPFALLGLAIGFQASTNASAAILNAILMPSAIFSGLWMPLEFLPAFFGHVAPFLPSYHLARIALAQIGPGEVLSHALVLLGMTAVTGALAALSYRFARP
ncbi:ABC transporter permease [Umezawaea endophytica]|uniref:ABC transporter permease n=1 Tax=Umezawaea endophytica TaxID=1654476 RepID=A0A9X3AH74_9PSEU|nr:ABC transporter permease [Umezawaea endophytica]MCS7481082.1 ABC transporter permease [Umezawaea endophytica]